MNPRIHAISTCADAGRFASSDEERAAFAALRADPGRRASWTVVARKGRDAWTVAGEALDAMSPGDGLVLVVPEAWTAMAPGWFRRMEELLSAHPSAVGVVAVPFSPAAFGEAGEPQTSGGLARLAAAAARRLPAGVPAADGPAPVAMLFRVAAWRDRPHGTTFVDWARWTRDQWLRIPGEWGIALSPYHGHAREEMMDLVPSHCRTVLEIGCGEGRFGELLRRRPGVRVTGIELDPTSARLAASRLDRVLHADVLEVELREQFDAVVALDALEHLTSPERVLERIAGEWLGPGGTLVVSLPNAGHWSVVRELLAGRCDPMPAGVLCLTHRRPFTPASARDWLGNHGFEVRRETRVRTAIDREFAALLREPGAAALGVDEDSLATVQFGLAAGLRPPEWPARKEA